MKWNLSSIDFRGDHMSVVSPKTLEARKQVSSVLVRHTCGKLTMAQAEHELWRIVNGLTDNYDEGYNAGYRAREEESALSEQRAHEPEYREINLGRRRKKGP